MISLHLEKKFRNGVTPFTLDVRYDIGDAQSDQRNPHARRYPRGVNALVFVIHPYHLQCL